MVKLLLRLFSVLPTLNLVNLIYPKIGCEPILGSQPYFGSYISKNKAYLRHMRQNEVVTRI